MNQLAECIHIKADGQKCAGVAIKDSEFCRFHDEDRKIARRSRDMYAVRRARYGDVFDQDPDFKKVSDQELHSNDLFDMLDLPTLEDPVAVRQWITAILRALATGQIRRGSAGTLLYGLQLAMLANRDAINLPLDEAMKRRKNREDELEKEFGIGPKNQDWAPFTSADIGELQEFYTERKPLSEGLLKALYRAKMLPPKEQPDRLRYYAGNDGVSWLVDREWDEKRVREAAAAAESKLNTTGGPGTIDIKACAEPLNRHERRRLRTLERNNKKGAQPARYPVTNVRPQAPSHA